VFTVSVPGGDPRTVLSLEQGLIVVTAEKRKVLTVSVPGGDPRAVLSLEQGLIVVTAEKRKVLTVSVPGGDCSVPLSVTFRPAGAERYTADIYISIRHNIYDDSFVQLIGEGYVETVTIDDVSCSDDFDPPLVPAPVFSAAGEEGAAIAGEEEDTPG